MNFCQAPICAQVATHAVWERDDTHVLVCDEHAAYVDAVNAEVPESRQVAVEPLGGSS